MLSVLKLARKTQLSFRNNLEFAVFSNPTLFSASIHNEQELMIKRGKSFDHIFEPESKRRLKLSTQSCCLEGRISTSTTLPISPEKAEESNALLDRLPAAQLAPYPKDEFIQLAGEQSGSSGAGSKDSPGDDRACNCQTMCGPNPKSAFVGVLAFLVAWSIVSVGMNLFKQVSVLDVKFRELEAHYSDLKTKFKDFTVNSNNQIENLRYEVHILRQNQVKSSPVRPTYNPMLPEPCFTEDGKRCLFPFKFKGETFHSCIQNWSDRQPWCATKLDADGNFIRFDSTAWGHCGKSCRISE